LSVIDNHTHEDHRSLDVYWELELGSGSRISAIALASACALPELRGRGHPRFACISSGRDGAGAAAFRDTGLSVTGIVSRFAPSTTGFAHPGTLLSALLVWLDVRQLGGRAVLRLEDVDHTRCRPQWADEMRVAMAWMGLEWDQIAIQSARLSRHEAALDQLASAGRLYPCSCTRSQRSGGRRAPDGGWAYENSCRERRLPLGGWRAVTEALRVRLDDDRIDLIDEGGLDLSQAPAREMGDPVVRRRDGVLAYQLVVVVDDADQGVTRVVRGRDIAASTATQVLLQRLLGVPTPTYRHHLLLVEPATEGTTRAEDDAGGAFTKLAKLHGSIPFSEVRTRTTGAQLCGVLAHSVGLQGSPTAITPAELVESFSWSRVRRTDLIATWSAEHGLTVAEP
jgi:glutamyl-Q tRNA(Asp) synthetase